MIPPPDSHPPYQAGRKSVRLAQVRPDVAAEWHPGRNGNVDPGQVAAFSHQKVWWRCPRRHVWQASIASRVRGAGCPFCSGRRTTRATSLAGRFPDLASQWHPERNPNSRAELVSPGSKQKVWWRCERGHEWQARISSRVAGRGCPYCARRLVDGPASLSTLRADLLSEWDSEANRGSDPALLAVGSNRKVWWHCAAGHRWEATVASRTRRGTGCPYCAGRRVAPERSLAALKPDLAHEWHPRRNRPFSPHTVSLGSNRQVWWRCERGHLWQARIQWRVKGTGCPYCSGRRVTPTRSLAACRPKWLVEWDEERNVDLNPKEVTVSSSVPVWWRCQAGHSWQASPNRRSKGSGCPYCAGRRILPERSLAALHPDLAAELDEERNHGLDPWLIAPAANRKLWWRCGRGHVWSARVSSRSAGRTGCPTCADRGPKGVPIFEACPDLAAEWDRELNDGKGEELTTGSKVKAWWRCPLVPAHRWRTSVHARARGTGCPYCAHRRPAPDTCLATVAPTLAASWHPTLNGDLSPTDVLPGSPRRIWWRCPDGHNWVTSLRARSRGTGCPYCSRRLTTPDRSLSVVRPDLAQEWHPRRNGELSPSDVATRSNLRVWWRCPEGHVWEAQVSNRTRGAKCPKCRRTPAPQSSGGNRRMRASATK